jgi:hypothetical protein
MWVMAGHARLRRTADPVVAAKPAGVRIRTRIRPSVGEAAVLTAIGEFLGSVYRGELVGRAGWAQRKHALTAVSSSLNSTGPAD